MEIVQHVLRDAGQAVIDLLTLPYFYIAIALVWWHTKLGVTLQRRLFHVRLYGSLHLTLTRLLAGIVVGLVLSLISFGAGADFTSETIIFIWVMMGLLALFQMRYICMAYAAGALGILQVLSGWIDLDTSQGVISDVTRSLAVIDIPGLLFMAGILHVGEGALVRLKSSKLPIPLFLQGKRGKPMGAHALTGVWPIPLFWLIPSASGGFTLPWTPMFGVGGEVLGWTLLAFPVLIGFSDRTASYWPEDKARASGNLLILYGVIVALLAVGAHLWSPLIIVASLATFLLHEGVVYVSRWKEKGRETLFSQDGKGVKILAVLPHTPAAEMGIQAGEIIKKANGMAVRSKEQLHAALELQSAFCKLDVVNRDGHIKFLQRARYAGEHYQLGLILAPDDAVEFVVAPKSGSIWSALRKAGTKRLDTSPTMIAHREALQVEAELAAAAQQLAIEAAKPEELMKNIGFPSRLSKNDEK